MSRLLPLLCFFACACDSRTSALIEIDGPMPMKTLDFDATLPGHHVEQQLVKAGDPSLQLPATVLLLLPDVAATVELSISGTEEGGRQIAVTKSFASLPHSQLKVSVALEGPNDDFDLSMYSDLAGTDLSGTGADLVGTDSAPSQNPDLANSDLLPVPSLTLLAGLPGGSGDYDNVGRDARLNVPEQPVLIGTSLYVLEFYGGALRKVDVTSGQVTTVPMFEGANPFFAQYPVGMAQDGAGHIYFAQMFDHTIRMLTLATGQETLVAGTPGTSGSADSPSQPSFNQPYGLAFDGNGDLWVTDSSNFTIRKIHGSTVSTVAGSPGVQEIQDGSGAGAHFQRPYGMAFYNGDLYITDQSALRKLSPSPSPAPVSTVLPSGFVGATGIASDGAGNFLVVDQAFNDLHKVSLAPANVIVAGLAGYQGDFLDGIGGNARLSDPRWLLFDGAGSAYLTEGSAVRKVSLADFNVTTLAGMSPSVGSTDSPRGRFNGPSGVAFDGTDTIYVADRNNNRVRTVSLSTGNVSTLAGDGSYSSADGQGVGASFFSPVGVALDGNGSLYVSDEDGHCIRKVGLASPFPVTTIAGQIGNPGAPSPSPMPGTMVRFVAPHGLAFDGDHTLYVADSGNDAIRSIDLSSGSYVTATVAGGTDGNMNGIGTAAQFSNPRGLAWDKPHHTLYVSDNYNQTIRKIDLSISSSPNVTTLTGTSGSSGINDGTLAQTTFGGPDGLLYDNGILWVADGGAQSVRRLDLVAGMSTTPIGVPGALLTKPGPLPARIRGASAIQKTPLGLVISSMDENCILLATGLQ